MKKSFFIPSGVALGVVIGTALSVALDNIAVGIGVGFVFVAGAIVANKKRSKSSDDETK